MKSRVHPKYKTKYRVGNWAEYDRTLVQRGDITLWILTDAADAWKPAPSGRRGGQRKSSDHTIETALTLRLVFKCRFVRGRPGRVSATSWVEDAQIGSQTLWTRERGQESDNATSSYLREAPPVLVIRANGAAPQRASWPSDRELSSSWTSSRMAQQRHKRPWNSCIRGIWDVLNGARSCSRSAQRSSCTQDSGNGR